MFTSVKNRMKRDKLIRLLGFLVQAATVIPEGATAPVGFALIPEKDAKELATAEPTFVSINPNVPANSEGKVQVAAVAAGIAAYQAAQAPAAGQTAAPIATDAAASGQTAAPAASTEFAISSDIPLPSIQRGGGVRESKYPFSKLEIGQSFFVKSTPKAFASTISGQNRKFAKTTPKRKFTLRAVTEGNVTGVRVWRMAVEAEAPAAQ